jgi:hypothetical protein
MNTCTLFGHFDLYDFMQDGCNLNSKAITYNYMISFAKRGKICAFKKTTGCCNNMKFPTKTFFLLTKRLYN